ncbi:hypothetical protein EMCG_06104 [[Emmonsia] crescens]|uniref:Uncharacterized protein n=1 Tax=[Emmonsia] crescens TaxID=73230 RepID=A0A0G2ICC7_9EURO|nr:hypothetical protein EMCG_06104 [Emmonsia crescens UAMH 3008]
MPILPLREKIKRVFSRSGSWSPQTSKDPKNQKPSSPISGYWPKPARNPNNKAGAARVPIAVKPGKIKYRPNGKPKIELYKAHEVPRSKYRGPFDEAHIERLAAYSIPGAMLTANRPRSMLSELSPTGTRAPPSRRGSVVSEREVVQHINGEVAGAAHPRHPLMTSPDASDSEIISLSAPPTTTVFFEQGADLYATPSPSLLAHGQKDLDYGSNMTPSTMASTLHPVDGNMSSSTLLTVQTQDTPLSQSDTAAIISKVSEPEKAPASPSTSTPVSSEELSSALNAIKLRS